MGKRGQKTCKGCGATTGPRTHACPSCGLAFVFKGEAVAPASEKVSWKTLEEGEIIKVVSGSGPYFNGKEDKISMGYSGIFRVKYTDETGIHAYPVKATESGHCFILMKSTKSVCGLVNQPHRIRRLKKAEKRRRKLQHLFK